MPTISQLSVKVNVDASGLTAGLASASQQVSVFANQTTSVTNITNKFAAEANNAGMAARFMGSELGKAGREMTVMGAGIVGAIGAMIKVGADLDTTIQKAVSNTNLAGKAIDEFRSQILQIGATMPASLDSIATGMRELVNIGYTGKDAMMIFAEGAKVAIATGADSGKTISTLGVFMHQMHHPATEAGNDMNFLHMMMMQAKVTVEQFTPVWGRLSAVILGAGGSLRDAGIAFATLTKNGFTAPTAGTQLAGLVKQVMAPSDKAVGFADWLDEKMKKAGKTILDVHGQVTSLRKDLTAAGFAQEGFGGIANHEKQVSGATGVSVASMNQHLFVGQRGGQAMGALAGFGNKDMNSFAKQQITLDEQYAAAQLKLNFQLGLFKNHLQIISEQVQSVVLPTLLKLTEWAVKGMQVFEALPAPLKAIAVGAVLIAGGALLAIGPLLSMAGTLLTVSAAAAAADVTIGALAMPFIAIAAAIVLPIVAIGALALALYTNFGGIRTAALKFVGDIKGPLVTIWNSIYAAVKDAWSAIRLAIEGALKAIWGVLEIGWGIIAGIVTVGLNLLAGNWKGAWDGIVKYTGLIFKGIKDLVVGLVNAIGNTITAAGTLLYHAGMHLMQGLANGIMTGGTVAINTAKGIANSIIGAMNVATGTKVPLLGMTGAPKLLDFADSMDATTVAKTNDGGFTSALLRLESLSYNAYNSVKGKVDSAGDWMKNQLSNKGFQEPGAPPGGDGGGGPGKKGRNGREDHTASDLASAIASVQDKLFDATHTDQMIKIKDAYKEYLDNLKTGVPLQLAEQLYYSQFGKIIKDSADEANKALAATAAAAAAAAAKVVDLNRKIADTLYNKTHSQSEIGKRDNYQNFLSNIVGGASPALTNSLFSATNKQIDEDDAQKKKDKMDKFVAELVKGIEHWNKAVATEAAKVSENTRSFYSRLTEETSRASTNLLAVTDPMKAKWLDFLQGFSDRLGGMTGGALIKAMADLKAAFARINEDNGMADSLRKKKEQIQGFADDTKSILAGAFEGLFQSGIKGFFSKVLSGFTSMFQQIAAQAMAGAATRGLMSLFGGILGGGATAGIAGGGGGFAMSFGDSLTGLATGGGVDAGRTYMVGEKGPELFRSSSAGSITSNSDLSRAIGSGGGGGNVYHLHIHDAKDTQSIKNSSRQILNSLSQQIDQNAARNGRR